jgi:CubicO group peptidase (beta-lactamase class C family)
VQAYEANQARIRDAGTLAGQAMAARNGTTFLDHPDEFFNNRHVLGLEIPSANGTSTARSLARLFAMLAMGGELDGVRLLSPQTVRAFGTVQVRSPDATGEDDPGGQSPVVPWGLGYIGNFAAPGRGLRYGPVESAFGSEGGGGEIAFCDPEHRISVGFVRSQLDMIGTFSARLIDTLYRCVGERA